MEHRRTSLLFAACVLATARAQLGAVDTDWLTDDPHKADRLPIWSQLMRNRGFGYGSYGSANQSPVTYRGWNNASRNYGSNWNLPTLYRIILLRQMLNNNNNNNSKTPTTPSRATNDNKYVSNNSQDWRNQLQNFYRVVLLTRLLSNQNGSNSNTSSRR